MNSIPYCKKKVEGEMVKNEKFFVDGIEYNPQNVLIIAELGTSHGADTVKAGELIEAAAEAGANCVKSQIVYADEILYPNTGEVTLPGGKIRLYDRFKNLEVPLSFFADVKEKVEKRGLLFLCTPFGLQSAREIRQLTLKCIKIASPELNYSALVKEIASYKLPTLLSTGVSRLGDIEEALSVMDDKTELCLLHCVTAYPAPEKDYNLRLLQSLASIFGVPVGVSDHSLDPCLVPVLGTAMGAAVIEKHFCLSRSDPGLDDPIALPPNEFARMVKAVRKAEKAGPGETLDALYREKGRDQIEEILGDGVKRLAPSEKANYELTNRSIHALRDIREGEIIMKQMIACLRTEKILRPGLHPAWEEKVIGRRARVFIPAGEGIRFEDLAGQ
jgi:sialic acid synthase SpsE